MDRSSRRTLLVYLFYAGLSIAFCSPLFAQPTALGVVDWDQHLFYYAEVIKNVVEYAQPPFWSPWYCGGNVLWQNPQVALLSPAYPLAAVAGLALAMKVNIVLHYWLGLIGMHLLLTRTLKMSFVPAIVFLSSIFVFSGAFALHLAVGHSVFLPALYLPLLLFFVIRALQTSTLRWALLGGAMLALMIYNGGLHAVPMTILAVGAVAAWTAAAEHSWRPVILALIVGVSGAAYAAPKLVPVSLFVTGDRFWDARDQPDHPDRMTAAMVLRTYVDSSQRTDSRFSVVQRHGWWEYGNYIGMFAACLLAGGILWGLFVASARHRRIVGPLAGAALMFFVLSLGEFSAFAPATLLQRIPLFSSFRIPSRFTIAVVLFGTLATAVALQALLEHLVWTRTRTIAATVICAIGIVQLVTVNRRHFRDVFSVPPVEHGFRVLAGSGSLVRDAPINPYTPNSPMLRALMSDEGVMTCYEGLQLTRGADVERPLVWVQGPATVSSVVFTPNRVAFAVIGGPDRARVYLNQNYAPGWHSSAGQVRLDPRDGGRMYVELAPGQTGRFAFSFVPPGLVFGGVLLLLAVGASAFVWNRTLAVGALERRAAEPPEADTVSLAARVERLSKPIILISLAGAIAARLVLSEASYALQLMSVAAFGISLLLGLRWPAAVSVVLACTYLGPLLVARLVVFDAAAYLTFWIPALLGVTAPRWAGRRWSIPAPWRVPLVGWGLAAAVTWPIIVAREFDFHPEPFTLLTRPSSAYGLITVTTALIVADTAAALMLAVLWFDWLCATFADDSRTLVRVVILPLLTSCAIACAFGVYQFAVDIRFLNPSWGVFGRAGSTLIDANAFGMIAVLGTCGFLALIDRRRSRLWNAAMAAALALAGVAVWASGSKTALIAELIAVAFAVWSWSPAPRRDRPAAMPRDRRRRLMRLALASVIVAAFIFVLAGSGPARRIGFIVPRASVGAMREFAVQLLWRRAGYGTAAVEMIRTHPWFGVGVGTFGVIAGDYYYSHLGTALGPDNAQNWIRHYLAEFGLIGSLGWIVWAIVVVRSLVRSRAGRGAHHRATVLAGGLVAVVAMSQVGLPMINPLVAITFWTFLFWFFVERAAPETGTASIRAAVPSWQWLMMTVLLVVFFAGTLRSGLTTLRVPMRARNAGWGYSYGISRAQSTPSGEEFRWTQQRAVVVVPAEKRLARVTIWVTRQDLAANPVMARVWHEQRLVIDTVLRDRTPVSAYVVIDRDPPWLMVRTYMDRVLPPDARERGMALQWTFLDKLPDGVAASGSAYLDPRSEETAVAAGRVQVRRPRAVSDVESEDDVARWLGQGHADLPALIGFKAAFDIPAARAHADRIGHRPIVNGDVEETHRSSRGDHHIGPALSNDPESVLLERHAIVERVHDVRAVPGRIAGAARD